MNKETTKEKINNLIKEDEKIKNQLIDIVFDYAKMEGLVSASSTKDSIRYKKIIREEFGLVI